MTEGEKKLVMKIKSIVLDYGDRFACKDQMIQVNAHIEDNLNVNFIPAPLPKDRKKP